jgi:glycerate 2-kinase
VPVDLARDPRLVWHHGGHPLPDAGSVAAGHAVARLVDEAPADARFLVLLSGGASALLELPAPGATLESLRAATARGLAGGRAIDALNRERSALSQLKGGGLARRLRSRPTAVLFISDVAGDDPRVVGSGPCWDDAGTIDHRCVGSNADARAAIAAFASRRGIAVEDHGGLAGEATATGGAIAASLRQAAPGLHLWGGECTVTLPADAGRGGRCQQLALAAVEAGLDAGDALLACGTDGRDGPGRAAGALVDGGTRMRLAEAGVDAAAALVRCDAGRALEAVGDLVDSGPTGTNVADLVIAFRAGQPRLRATMPAR